MVFRYLWPVTAIIMTVFAAYFHFADTDNNPVIFKGNNNILFAYNINEKLLWEPELPFNAETVLSPHMNKKLYSVGDIDGDKKNEIILSPNTQDDVTDLCGMVICINYNGKILWSWNEHKDVTFGTVTFSNNFYNKYIIIHDFNKDGIAEILCCFTHRIWYPTKIIQFDKTGNILNTFYHSGHLDPRLIIDIDKDGIDEFITGGTNNEYNSPVMMVFKWPHFSGHAPQTNSGYIYRDTDFDYRPPWLYLLFPNSLNFLNSNDRGTVSNIFLLPDNSLYVSNSIAGAGPKVLYFFDKTFQVNSLSVNDVFHYTFRPGENSTAWDVINKEEFLDHMSKIKFWNGKTWVDSFAVNER